jgi:hypothetical protein
VVYLSNFNVNDQVDNPELSLSRGEPIAPTVGMAELANPIMMAKYNLILFVADSPASVPSRALRSAIFELREKSTPTSLSRERARERVLHTLLYAFLFVVPTTAEVVTTNWYYEFLC